MKKIIFIAFLAIVALFAISSDTVINKPIGEEPIAVEVSETIDVSTLQLPPMPEVEINFPAIKCMTDSFSYVEEEVEPTLEPNFDSEDPYYIRNVLLAGGDRELIGHATYLDLIGIKRLELLCKDRRIKSYITHNSHTDRTTHEIGYFENIREHNGDLIGDFRFLKSAIKHKPYMVDTLLEMTQVMPEEFGISLVIYTELVWVLESGVETVLVQNTTNVPPPNAKYQKPVLRPFDIISFDWVQSGALTPEGVFQTK